MVDRQALSQALAKATSYKLCGKDQMADEWAHKLVEMLKRADILRGE